MSTCPQCYVGHCRVHPLQDSGKRRQGIKDQEKRLNALHDKVIQDRLSAMQGAFGNSGTSEKELASYRERMIEEREKAEKRPRNELSSEAALLAASGMNGTTMKLMLGIDDDDDDRKKRKKEKKKSQKKEKKHRKHHTKEKKHHKKKSKHRTIIEDNEQVDERSRHRIRNSSSSSSSSSEEDEEHSDGDSEADEDKKKSKKSRHNLDKDEAEAKEHHRWVKAQLKKIKKDNAIENHRTKPDDADVDFGQRENNDLVKEQAKLDARQALENTQGSTLRVGDNGTMWKSMNLFANNHSFLKR